MSQAHGIDIHHAYFGLTLQAPWWDVVTWGYKRWENRGAGVAGQIDTYRGRVLLTASARHTVGKHSYPFLTANGDAHQETAYALKDVPARWASTAPTPRTVGWYAKHAGHAVATARIVEVVPPSDPRPGRYRVTGQYGVILDDVSPLEPFPVKGGQGFWRVVQCRCGAVFADSQKRHHKCKAPT